MGRRHGGQWMNSIGTLYLGAVHLYIYSLYVQYLTAQGQCVVLKSRSILSILPTLQSTIAYRYSECNIRCTVLSLHHLLLPVAGTWYKYFYHRITEANIWLVAQFPMVRPRATAWYQLHVEATRRNLILPKVHGDV